VQPYAAQNATMSPHTAGLAVYARHFSSSAHSLTTVFQQNQAYLVIVYAILNECDFVAGFWMFFLSPTVA